MKTVLYIYICDLLFYIHIFENHFQDITQIDKDNLEKKKKKNKIIKTICK